MLEKLNSPFPFYFNDDRKNTVLVLCISGFMFIFLTFVHAAELPGKLFKITLVSGVIFGVLFINIILFPRLFPRLFDSRWWTLGRYILFNIWQFAWMGAIGSTLLHAVNFYPELSYTEIMLAFYPRVLFYGLMPVIIVGLVLSNKLLQENLRTAIRANQELERIRVLKDELPEVHHALTIYSDTSETIKLKLADLLFVEADDNYSTFYWMNGAGLEKKMLRVNLKNVESQLDNAFTLRCHRSYIVNISQIEHVSGNANGYKLSIKDTDLSVPVSRSKGKEVIEKIGQLRNSIEIR